jgi:hypothetical protein
MKWFLKAAFVHLSISPSGNDLMREPKKNSTERLEMTIVNEFHLFLFRMKSIPNIHMEAKLAAKATIFSLGERKVRHKYRTRESLPV